MVLSLDGRKEVNDRFRVDLAGNGSYADRIVPKFKNWSRHAAARELYARHLYASQR